MAIVLQIPEQIMDTPLNVDFAMMDAMTEEDLRRHAIEDGDAPAFLSRKGRLVTFAGRVRKALDITQPAFADLIGMPVGTVRNWAQGRVRPDPAARALPLILWREPKAASRALRAREAA